LVELYVGDEVEVTHLKANIRPNGFGKFDSSNYMTVHGKKYDPQNRSTTEPEFRSHAPAAFLTVTTVKKRIK